MHHVYMKGFILQRLRSLLETHLKKINYLQKLLSLRETVPTFIHIDQIVILKRGTTLAPPANFDFEDLYNVFCFV